jgi:hypothetical protein
MSTETQFLDDETLTRRNENVSQVWANNLQPLYIMLNEQMKTFDFYGFKQSYQRLWAQIKTDTNFPLTQRLYFEPLNNTGRIPHSMNSDKSVLLIGLSDLSLKQTKRLVSTRNGVHSDVMLTYVRRRADITMQLILNFNLVIDAH